MESDQQETPGLSDKTILIVEDDPTSQEFIREVLRPTDAKLLIKGTGKAGLMAFADNQRIDLVLMDIRLPDVSGTEVIRKIREKNAHIPIVVQTAYAMGEDKQKYLQAGANGYIAKPIEVNGLFAVLNKYMTSIDR